MVWVCLVNAACWKPSGPATKHVILISVDTLRRDHVTPYGYGRETTPNLEKLARSGIVFENAFAANTNTAPSHASMLTGLHPHEHGVLRNGYALDEEVVTLGQYLGDSYVRAAFVSGYPMQRTMTELDRGFDHYDDDFDGDWQRRAEQTIARAEAWLGAREDSARGLFLFVHLYDPHHPYDAPAGFATRFLPPGQDAFQFPGESAYERFWKGEASQAELDEYVGRYDGEIAYADHQLGRLFEVLQRLGYWDEALVLVVSDHGETLGERAAPFTHGARLYDEQLRVPLLMRLPGDRHAGSRIVRQVHHVDLAPTILDFLAVDPGRELDGDSMRPRVEARDSATGVRPVYSTALPQAWRLPEVGAEFDHGTLVAAIRTPDWKLVSYPGVDGKILHLFDLKADPGETRALAPETADPRGSLSEQLDAWQRVAGQRGSASLPDLNEEQEEALRALGYLE
jgi:arylsulfatase A-like enzyme